MPRLSAFLPILWCWMLAVGVPSIAASSTEGRLPNVVVIFCDDLGYGDLGCYGNRSIRTPHLDRLATQGVRFTDFYTAQPVCSAARAALLTGCYPNRIGIHGALDHSSTTGLSAEETTLPELLRDRGYATGMVGKWHLGHTPEFLPTRHGFDRWYGLPYSNDMWPYHPEAKPGSYPPLPLYENERVIDDDVRAADQQHLTVDYTRRAVEFIHQHRHQPFFLYVAHTMPHVPLFVSARREGRSKHGLFADVVEELDWSVGEILRALRRNRVADRTLVVFTSDNGPWLSYGEHAGSSGGLREGKGTCWEGGVRVPMIARWPGVIPAGATCREPAMTIDLLPTLARAAGAPLPARPIDGRDLTDLLRRPTEAGSPHEALWFYYHQNQLQALRSGPWKLILPHTYRTLGTPPPPLAREGRPVRYQNRQAGLELYDLRQDPAETTDRAAAEPEVVARLSALVEKARADLGDALTGRDGPGRRPPGRRTTPAP